MTKKFFLIIIKIYQYFSRLMPNKCRYYPSCSEYAKWQFETTNPFSASLNSALRILRCNQLFSGGIDYPVIVYKPPKLNLLKRDANYTYGKINVKYWLIPKDTKYYFVVKVFNDCRVK